MASAAEFSSKYRNSEQQIIANYYKELVTCIKKSVGDTTDRLFSNSLITDEEKNKLRDPTESDANKARIIVDSIHEQLKFCTNPSDKEKVFEKFLGSLFCAEDFRKKLKDDLEKLHYKDRPEEQAKEFYRLQTDLSTWEVDLATILSQKRENGLELVAALEIQNKKLNNHKQKLTEIGEKSIGLMDVIVDNHQERILRDDKNMEDQLIKIEGEIIFEKFLQRLCEGEKIFEKKLEELYLKEKKIREQKPQQNFVQLRKKFQHKQKERENLTEEWDRLVQHQRKMLDFLKENEKLNFDDRYVTTVSEQYVEAKDGLQHSSQLRDYLNKFENCGQELKEQEETMQDKIKIYSEYREIFHSALLKNSTDSATRDCKQIIEYCERNMKECDEMVHNCQREIKTIVDTHQQCIEEAEKVRKQIRECQSKLCKCIQHLEICENRLKDCLDQLKEESELLSEKLKQLQNNSEPPTRFSSVMASIGATTGATTGAIATAGAVAGTSVGPVGTFVGGVVGGTAGLVIGGTAGLFMGLFKPNKRMSREDELKIENVRQELNKCEDSVMKCQASVTDIKKVASECKQELDDMRICISKMEFLKEKLTAE